MVRLPRMWRRHRPRRAIGTSFRDSRGHRKIVGVNWDVTTDIQLQEDLRKAKQVSDLQNSQLEEARLVMESAALHDALTGICRVRGERLRVRRSWAWVPI